MNESEEIIFEHRETQTYFGFSGRSDKRSSTFTCATPTCDDCGTHTYNFLRDSLTQPVRAPVLVAMVATASCCCTTARSTGGTEEFKISTLPEPFTTARSSLLLPLLRRTNMSSQSAPSVAHVRVCRISKAPPLAHGGVTTVSSSTHGGRRAPTNMRS